MSGTLQVFINDLEEALRDFIDEERMRLEVERDFLTNVLRGRTDGVNIEDPSTELTQAYLEGYLSQYIPIEKDLST